MPPKLDDPTGIFEIQPRHAAYIVVTEQMQLIQKVIANQKVLAGYFKQRAFLSELPEHMTSDPIQLAQMLSAFTGMGGMLEQYQAGIFAFGLLTTDKQSELETLSKKYSDGT